MEFKERMAKVTYPSVAYCGEHVPAASRAAKGAMEVKMVKRRRRRRRRRWGRGRMSTCKIHHLKRGK